MLIVCRMIIETFLKRGHSYYIDGSSSNRKIEEYGFSLKLVLPQFPLVVAPKSNGNIF